MSEKTNKSAAVSSSRLFEANERNQIVPHFSYTRERERDREDKNLLGNIFSTRRPKHAGAGLVSGLKTVTKGILVGTGCLFISPYVCAKAEGLCGLFKGIFWGIISAIIIPLMSVGVASYQIGRGIINTPESITQKVAGKIWDEEKREWYDFYYNLDEEASQVLNDTGEADEKMDKRENTIADEYYNKSGTVKVKDDEFYRILQVSTNATQSEIKRQYYQLAKQYHPDKCTDLQAKEEFQKIGEAYQVLGDVERRKRYDKEGKQAINNMQFIDATFFFTLLFGSEKLDPYIGKLRMVMYVEYEQVYKEEDVHKKIAKEQNKREVQLALNLRERINNYIFGNAEEYMESFKKEVKDLCQTSFGHVILENVAWTYENCANQYLGEKNSLFGISGKYYKMQQKKRVIGTGFKFVKTLIKTSSLANQIKKKEEDENMSLEKSAKVNKKIEDSLLTIVETMLNICLIDIDHTIRGVCKKVFTDMSVDEKMRKTRAETLFKLAKAMKSVVHEFKKNNEIADTKTLFEDACIKACQMQEDNI